MFTWICPQCGREVPPAYTECPDCAAKAASGASGGLPAVTAGSPLGTAAPPQRPLEPAPPPAFAPSPAAPAPATFPQQQPAQPVYTPAQAQSPLFAAPPPPPPPRAKTHLPTWLLAILFFLLFGGILTGAYFILRTGNGPSSTVESPAAKPGAKTSPYQKYIEVSGLRFIEDKKKIMVRFVLVNHSDSDMISLPGNVTVWARTRKSEEEAVGTFSFTTSIAARESKELTLPFTTKLKMIEMPDWQNVTTDVQITAQPAY